MLTAIKERPILFSGPMIRAILEGRKTQTRRVIKPQPRIFESGKVDGFVFDSDTHSWMEFFRLSTGETVKSSFRPDLSCPYGKAGDRKFTSFKQASPPSNGWYWVKWEPADQEKLVLLTHVPLEAQDDTPDHDVYNWVWQESEQGDPESVCLDIADPLEIQWKRPGDRLWCRETWANVTDDGRPECFIYKADQGELSQYKIWKPSIHMPRKASRILLEIVNVRVERLQDISEEDAIAEGIQPLDIGYRLWDDYLNNGGDHKGSYYPGFRNPIKSFRFLWDSINSLWDSINGKTYPWDSNPWVWVLEFRVLEPAVGIATSMGGDR